MTDSEASRDRTNACYEAMGLLITLVEYDRIPAHHLSHAKQIITAYEDAEERLKTKVAA